jgi:hypothetical protein|uniref:Uncharacterized protein n=1 Tax=viral metagenome TaxID=1070528 RepID=A0A6C0JN59_9ZZZZ
MNWLIPIVMGTTAVVYINSFNYIMKLYADSEYTLTWEELVEKMVFTNTVSQ